MSGAPRSIGGAWLTTALVITGVVLVLCLLPGDGLPEIHSDGFDKFQHAVAFAALGFAWHRARVGLRVAAAIGVVLAAATELGQGLLDVGRTAEGGDVAADLAGLAVGLLVSVWSAGERRAREPGSSRRP